MFNFLSTNTTGNTPSSMEDAKPVNMVKLQIMYRITDIKDVQNSILISRC